MAMLISRMARVVDRAHALESMDDQDRRAELKALIPDLRRRAKLIHYALGFSILSGIVTALLVVLAFVGALLNLQLETPVATLFIVSLLCRVPVLAGSGGSYRFRAATSRWAGLKATAPVAKVGPAFLGRLVTVLMDVLTEGTAARSEPKDRGGRVRQHRRVRAAQRCDAAG